jgi:hypothetical protein
LAKRAGLSYPNTSVMVNGNRHSGKPYLWRLMKIADVLGMRLIDLLNAA